MVATVAVEFWATGSDGSPNKTSAATLRFRTDDSPNTIDNTNSIVIPTAGSNFSFWQHVALAISGTFTQVDNIRFHSDGTVGWTFGAAGELSRGNRDSGDHGCTEANYDVATGTPATTGDEINDAVNGHGFYEPETVSTADVDSDTSGSPATIDSAAHTSSESSKAVVLQVKLDSDATLGAQSSETLTFLYDEI